MADNYPQTGRSRGPWARARRPRRRASMSWRRRAPSAPTSSPSSARTSRPTPPRSSAGCTSGAATPTPSSTLGSTTTTTTTTSSQQQQQQQQQQPNSGRRLRLENVGWADEGEYRCVAYNVINGVRREMPSDLRFVLHVIGPPEIQARPSAETEDGMYESIGWAGEPVHRLKSRFCSRPPPRIVAWQWGTSTFPRRSLDVPSTFPRRPTSPSTKS
jgi:hypothetical protein